MFKKKYFVLGGTLITIVSLFEVLLSYNQNSSCNDLLLANVEALTVENENGSSSGKSKCCWVDVSNDPELGEVSTVWYCGDCTEVPCTSRSNMITCRLKKK